MLCDMPELPEVQTTVNGLRRHIVGLRITGAWSDYDSRHYRGSDTIKDRAYFERFKEKVIGARIISVDRRAKNILIGIETKKVEYEERGKDSIDREIAPDDRKTILVHMKMTGHLLYGQYRFDSDKDKDPWEPIEPEALKDPFNRHVHFVISFSNGRHLALSDVRKFAKVTLVDGHGAEAHASEHLSGIGPEPLERTFTLEKFEECLDAKSTWKIKQALMDQSVIAGIGNIYADESLWRAGIHPTRRVNTISMEELRLLFSAIKRTLSRGINLGGDSTSDYRDVDGAKGAFHEGHHAYQRSGSRCDKRGCSGTIRRMVLGGRGTHYCDTHQPLKKRL